MTLKSGVCFDSLFGLSCAKVTIWVICSANVGLITLLLYPTDDERLSVDLWIYGFMDF